ncbi:MAG TPA: hemolysin family protein [Candidatus Sulfopaludibacter sp.]|nr:hemolysin family protein [Candidatus Sulfopaludibacter sp.]
MEPAVVTAVVVILISAGASFFFALAEAALLSLSKWQARQLAERHPRAGAVVARLLEQPQDLLATMALGNTFANAAMLALALQMVFDGRWPFVLTLALLLALILIGCEVLPKTLAVRQPERWARRTAWLLLLFQKTTGPLSYAAQKLNEVILNLAAPQFAKPTPALTDGEYHELLEMAYQQGTLAESEKEIILQIVSLDQRMVREVMRPRTGMACISDDATVEEMMGAARKFKHRRLPIYDETPDTIVGILNTRALLLDPNIDLADAIEFPSFVPETMNLLQLFQSLQKQQRGLAVVLDEFGSTAGIVTMEDILGQIVGKIRAEARQPEGFVMEKLTPGRWRVNGTMRLDDFRREFPALGNTAEAETMGGLLVHLLGVVPGTGESAMFNGLKLTAQVVDDRRIRELLVETVK